VAFPELLRAHRRSSGGNGAGAKVQGKDDTYKRSPNEQQANPHLLRLYFFALGAKSGSDRGTYQPKRYTAIFIPHVKKSDT
jgi:hypothetical protein